MATATQDLHPAVDAEVMYTVNTGETLVAIVHDGATPDDRTGQFEPRTVSIDDARPENDGLDLDREGVKLIQEPTAVTDWFDEDQVRNVYYPEVEAMLLRETGAKEVLIFDHTIRIGDPEKQKQNNTRAPVKNVHNDFTEDSAPLRVRQLYSEEEAEKRLARRFTSVNVWRPLRGPVKKSPLAIADAQSIDPADWVRSERHYGDRVGVTYNISYNPKHRWLYFPEMETDEAVLLKCYDSDTSKAQYTAHGTFEDPAVPADAPPRESIEIRTLLFY